MDSLIRIDYCSKENYWSPTSLGVEDSTAEISVTKFFDVL